MAMLLGPANGSIMGGLKNIAGQTTVPFFSVFIFWGRNWCSYFDTNTNYCTYDKPRGASPLEQFLLVGPLFLCVEKVRGRK